MIGIDVAMEKELKPLLDKFGEFKKEFFLGNTFYTFSKYPHVVAVLSGVGEISAAMATTLLIQKYSITRIINYGFVGYYGTDRNRGDILNISKVYNCDVDLTIIGNKPGQYDDYDSDSIVIDTSFFNKYDFAQASLSSCEAFLDASSKRDSIIEIFGENAADMEGAGIAFVCHKAKIPCSILKVISNTLDQKYDEYYQFSLYGINEISDVVFSSVTVNHQSKD